MRKIGMVSKKRKPVFYIFDAALLFDENGRYDAASVCRLAKFFREIPKGDDEILFSFLFPEASFPDRDHASKLGKYLAAYFKQLSDNDSQKVSFKSLTPEESNLNFSVDQRREIKIVTDSAKEANNLNVIIMGSSTFFEEEKGKAASSRASSIFRIRNQQCAATAASKRKGFGWR